MGDDRRSAATENGARPREGGAARLLIPERLRNMTDVRLAARLAEVVVTIPTREELDELAIYLRGRGLL